MIKFIVDQKEYKVEESQTILDFLQSNGYDIPTLCYLKDINNNASCRLCLVEDNNTNKLITSCSNQIYDGLNISTNSERVNKAVIMNLQLLISNHNADCINCFRNHNCRLQDLAEKYDLKLKKNDIKEVDDSLSTIVRDSSKCILCGRCIEVCKNVQKIGCLTKANRGVETIVTTSFNEKMNESNCISCGQCTLVCPTGALIEKSSHDILDEMLLNKYKHVVFAIAPSTRYALGEEFDMPLGSNVEKKLVAALKKIDVDKVFDLNLGADLTIIEEVNELINRLNKKENLPMFTSCCPSWINYVNKNLPEYKSNLSTCKSPQEMLGGIVKTYYAEKQGLNPDNIYLVMVMPCTAKKGEREKFEYVDLVLTTREMANILKRKHIELDKMKDRDFDKPLGEGNSEIFGASGGVMLSAIRTFYNLVTNENKKDFEFNIIDEGLSEYKTKIDGKEYSFGIVNGIGNIKRLIKENKLNYDFIEVMTCPGGCINGGGQPVIKKDIDQKEVIEKRKNAIKTADSNRKDYDSKNNEIIKKIYEEYLKKPNSHLAEKILHSKSSE